MDRKGSKIESMNYRSDENANMLASRMDRLDDKADRTLDEVSEIKVTLAQQHLSLEEHMRRSVANETAVALLAAQIEPYREHMIKVKGVGRFLAFIVTTMSAVSTAVGLYALLKH